jgi:hypothetical protein
METKEAIEILNEMKDSPFKWQSCNNAIDHVIAKVNELEKQLAEQKIISNENCNAYMISIGANKSLRKRLAEMMPDKIWCAANKTSSMYFYTEEDAEIYASSFGAACFMEVFTVDVLRLQEKANNE